MPSPNVLDWYDGAVALPCIYSKHRGPVFTASSHTQASGRVGPSVRGDPSFFHASACLSLIIAAHVTDGWMPVHSPNATQGTSSFNLPTTSSSLPSTHTQVSYHTRTPQMNDEVKLRLPDVLTPQHHLVFSVYHVHVKKQSSILSSLKHVRGIFGLLLGVMHHPGGGG